MFRKNKYIEKVDDRLKHIAFIMDGNGRWAEKKLMPRFLGHNQGAKAFKKIVKYCYQLGVKTVTAYAFSTENWSRPKNEIDAIIKLLHQYNEEVINDHHIKINYIGDKSNLPDDLAKIMIEAEEITKNREFTVNIAFNYGGRAEIVYACNNLISKGKTSITEQDISENIYTSNIPDPDLIIRTAGEYRLSNFLLWQCAYSEFYFTKVLWPDFNEHQLDLAIKDFYSRSRKFGGLDKR